MKTRRKAIAAGAVPVAVGLTMWAITGTLNAPEFALGLTGLLNAAVVYETPNAEEARLHGPFEGGE